MSRVATIIAGMFAVTVFAVAGGAGTSFVVARLLAVPSGAPAPTLAMIGADSPAAAPNRRVKSRQDYLNTIKCRNYFDPASNASCKPDEPLVAGAGTGGKGAAISELNVTLVGTLVAEPASFSSALILKDGPDQRAAGYGIGDKLEDATIIEIRRKEVVIRRGNDVEEVLVIGDDAPKPPPGAAPVAAASTTDGIEQLGENSYAISRELFNQHLTDLEGLSKLGRALQHRGPNGEFDGYRLSAIRRNTVAEQIGLRNGDIIHGVNGQQLSSMQAAMDAYTQLSGGSAFQVEVTRRGQKVQLDYQVR